MACAPTTPTIAAPSWVATTTTAAPLPPLHYHSCSFAGCLFAAPLRPLLHHRRFSVGGHFAAPSLLLRAPPSWRSRLLPTLLLLARVPFAAPLRPLSCSFAGGPFAAFAVAFVGGPYAALQFGSVSIQCMCVSFYLCIFDCFLKSDERVCCCVCVCMFILHLCVLPEQK